MIKIVAYVKTNNVNLFYLQMIKSEDDVHNQYQTLESYDYLENYLQKYTYYIYNSQWLG